MIPQDPPSRSTPPPMMSSTIAVECRLCDGVVSRLCPHIGSTTTSPRRSPRMISTRQQHLHQRKRMPRLAMTYSVKRKLHLNHRQQARRSRSSSTNDGDAKIPRELECGEVPGGDEDVEATRCGLQQPLQPVSPATCQPDQYRSPTHHPTPTSYPTMAVTSQPRDNIPLPEDPRQWSRDDVHHWLRESAIKYHIEDLDSQRFMFNGKALCLMLHAPQLFFDRVPNGGHFLYEDFKTRLRRATGS